MTSWKLKLWRSVGAAAFVAACGPTSEPQPVPVEPTIPGASGEAAIGESGGEGGVGAVTVYAGLSGDQRTALRLQHLEAFVLLAQRVASEGDKASAAALMQAGVRDAYDLAPTEFGSLNIAPFRAAADAESANIAQELNAAQAAIGAARQNLPTNHADLTVRMVDMAAAVYRQATMTSGALDPSFYQQSLGAALSAKEALEAGERALRGRDAAAYDEAKSELDRYIALWPSTNAPATPPSYQDVLRQSSRVRLALSAYL